jgi:hypothetical protein
MLDVSKCLYLKNWRFWYGCDNFIMLLFLFWNASENGLNFKNDLTFKNRLDLNFENGSNFENWVISENDLN